ncbi:MAG: phosphatidylinositol-specific phospholipase C domain-containing protein [Bacteroidaceae bacterium]
MLGTHNSMSYLPVSKWWMKPFAFIARCQNKSIVDQLKAGAQYIDLRVRPNKKGKWVFAHGLIEYTSITIEETLKEIAEYINEKSLKVEIVLTLEQTKVSQNDLDNFNNFCIYLQKLGYGNILNYATNKLDWKINYRFDNDFYPLTTSSFSSAPFEACYRDKGIYAYLPPCCYASAFNEADIPLFTCKKKSLLIIDFI